MAVTDEELDKVLLRILEEMTDERYDEIVREIEAEDAVNRTHQRLRTARKAADLAKGVGWRLCESTSVASKEPKYRHTGGETRNGI